MSVTESDRILAPGHTLTLVDGRVVTLRYGMRGLKALEDEFGSLNSLEEAVGLDEEGRPTGKVIGPIVAMLAAGLTAEGISADQLLDLLDPARLDEYADAAGKALEQALPAAEAGPGKASPSHGGTSTTSPPSASGATTNGSGR